MDKSNKPPKPPYKSEDKKRELNSWLSSVLSLKEEHFDVSVEHLCTVIGRQSAGTFSKKKKGNLNFQKSEIAALCNYLRLSKEEEEIFLYLTGWCESDPRASNALKSLEEGNARAYTKEDKNFEENNGEQDSEEARKAREQCLNRVATKIEEILHPETADLVKTTLSECAFEEYNQAIKKGARGKADAKELAEFMVFGLHDGENKQDVNVTINRFLLQAVKKLGGSSKLRTDPERSSYATDKVTKELFYQLLHWLVHISVANQYNLSKKYSSSAGVFNLPVSTMVAVEICMARLWNKEASFKNYTGPEEISGKYALNPQINIKTVTKETSEATAKRVLRQLWDFVNPDKPLKKDAELDEGMVEDLMEDIAANKEGEDIYTYIVSAVPENAKEVFSAIGKALRGLIPNANLDIVGFDKGISTEDKENILSIERKIKASIKVFANRLEQNFQ